jgi:hypothetical protein
MAGTEHGQSPGPALHRILYDEGFRQQLESHRSAYLARFGIGSDGRAAMRAAEAILKLTEAGKARAGRTQGKDSR